MGDMRDDIHEFVADAIEMGRKYSDVEQAFEESRGRMLSNEEIVYLRRMVGR